MPVDLKTQVASTAVRQGTVTQARAAEVEKLAEATKEMGAALKILGLQTDAFSTAFDSPALQRLSPAERQLFSHVYQEVLGNVSGALAALGGAPTPADIQAAYAEVGSVLDRMQALARRHGPGVVQVSPDAPDFKLDDHPQKILCYAHRVRGETQNDPHILVTFRADLAATRTSFEIAKSDLTPEHFVAALRAALGDSYANVELRARHEDGGPIAISKPAGAAPPAPAETRTEKFQRAADELTKVLDRDPVLAGRVTKVIQHEAELSPCLGVYTSIPEGPAFDAIGPQIQEAIAAWLEKNGHADLVTRNYLGNTIMVATKDGGLGV